MWCCRITQKLLQFLIFVECIFPAINKAFQFIEFIECLYSQMQEGYRSNLGLVKDLFT